MSCGCKDANTKCNCNCPPAEPGEPGTPWVIRATAEPAGANCTYGGWKIEGGPDQDLDGLPDSIKQTFFVCNGAPGSSRAIRVENEAPGVNCANGGFKITTGDDTNNDGLPDTNLVISYVCNGSAGANGTTPTLVMGTVTTLASGSSATANLVLVSGTTYRLDLGIPQGPTGPGTSTSGITVAGITIPSCLATELGGITQLNPFIEAILEKICSMATNTQNKTYAFRAEKTSAQNIQVDGGGNRTVRISFDDAHDAGNGKYDNSNSWFSDVYISQESGARTFVVENLKIKITGGAYQAFGTTTTVLAIVKDVSGVLTDIATSEVCSNTLVDKNLKSMINDQEYTFNTLYVQNHNLNVDDKVFLELRLVESFGSGATLSVEPNCFFQAT